MNLVDERILELLSEEGPLPPSEISEDDRMIWNEQYIGRRCRTLASYGMLQNVGHGVYIITDTGDTYLTGELDASTLDPDE